MSVNNPAAPNGLTMDLRALDRLKSTSGANPQAAVRETARQLESLFMNELMKSMRASTMSTGMLDNSGSEMATGMLDTQLAGQMTGRAGGLSDVIARQLERQMGLKPEPQPSASAPARGQDNTSRALTHNERTSIRNTQPEGKRLSNSEQFIRKHHAAAEAAESATGLPSGRILGQAALESGWGKREIKMKDGTPSHNLFGIKATSSWTGKVAEVTTTEYIGGVARKVTAKFRAYDSYEDAFKDHARLLTKNPRYSQTVAKADTTEGYSMGLQKAGYATDPAYAHKLTQVINTALRVQRSMT